MADTETTASAPPAVPASDRHLVLKMDSINYDEVRSNAVDPVELAAMGIWSEAGGLQPPYAPRALAAAVEGSNCLRQCIDAYITNIHKFGHRLLPRIDVEAPDADRKVADVIYLERLAEAENNPRLVVAGPTEEEVAARKQEISVEIRKEHARAEGFFDACCDGMSFVELRSRTCFDMESIGYAFWECLRNKLGALAELKHVPAYTVRLIPGGDMVEADVQIKVSPVTFNTVKKTKRFRKFVQVCNGVGVWFKEFGDKRVMSSKRGTIYDSVEELQAKEPGVPAATELLEFKIYSSASPYGVPRWIGNLLSVMGSHKAEKVNYLYFDNKAIPPMVILVEGGSLASGASAQIKDFLQNEIKGTENFHKILVLEAVASEGAPQGVADAKVRIRLEPLTGAMIKDGLFQEYDERNINKVGASFRLPKILRGDSSDVNRATADSALALTEQQVFSGERNSFDWAMDRQILADLGVRYHEFESLGPDLKNPEALSVASKAFENSLTPNELRKIAGSVFGTEFPPIEADWAKQPIALTLAGLGGGGLGAADSAAQAAKAQADGNALALAAHMVQLRREIRQAEEKLAQGEFRTEKRALDAQPEEHVVHVPATLMAKWLGQG